MLQGKEIRACFIFQKTADQKNLKMIEIFGFMALLKANLF